MKVGIFTSHFQKLSRQVDKKVLKSKTINFASAFERSKASSSSRVVDIFPALPILP